MSQPLVSIIIPVYNAAEYIGACIESIIHQTYNHIEIIIVNDGSNDSSIDIANNILKHIDNAQIIHQSNSGVNAARKAGFEKSSGDWIMFMDADDTLPPQAIEKLISYTDGYDLVSGRFQFIDERNFILDKIAGPKAESSIGNSEEFIKQLLLDNRYKCLWRQIIRKNKVQNNFFDTNKDIKIAEDYLVMLNIGLKISKYIGINDIVYNYRWYPTSTVHTNKTSLRLVELLTDAIIKIFDDKNLTSIYKPEIQKAIFNLYLDVYNSKNINISKCAKFLRGSTIIKKNFSKKDKFLLGLLYIPTRPLRKYYFNGITYLSKLNSKIKN